MELINNKGVMKLINSRGKSQINYSRWFAGTDGAELQLGFCDNCLEIAYDDKGTGWMSQKEIYFMNQKQLAKNPVDNVCYLPNCGETFITRDDYDLLDRFGLLEAAAKLVSCANG